MAQDAGGNFIKYRYEPSLVAAIIFTVLFLLTTLLHLFQTFRKRSWFLTPFIIGGLFQFVGYIGRIMSAQDPDALGPYIMQTLLLLLAPALDAASIYMILGRLILLTDGERYSLVRRTWLTKIFVGGDVFTFLLQSTGGSMMAGGDKDKAKFGKYVIIGGLILQIAFFGFFVLVAVLFQSRGRQHLAKIASQVPWQKHMYTLYATSIFILIRSVFRVVEYVQGNDGYLISHEIFLYIFDALLMFAVMLAMNIVHPGEIAPMLKEKANKANFEEMHAREPLRQEPWV